MLRCSFTYTTGFSPAVAIGFAVLAVTLPLCASISVIGNAAVAVIYIVAAMCLSWQLAQRKKIQLDINDRGEVLVSGTDQHWRITSDSRLSLWLVWLALQSATRERGIQRKMLVFNCAKLSEQNKRTLGAWIIKTQKNSSGKP